MSARAVWSAHVAVPLWGFVVTAASALALFPVVESKDFWARGLGGAAVVALTGVAMRATRSTRPFTVVAQLVALAVWASVLVAPREAVLGVLPTPATGVALWSDVERVLDLIRERAAPLPRSPALSTLMALGVAVLGLLVDLLAATARRAAVVGLALLAVYMVPVAALSGQVSMHAFWPGALAWVALLLATERAGMRRWSDSAGPDRVGADGVPGVTGVQAARSPRDGSSPGGFAGDLDGLGRQVGLGAVGIAVVLPLLLPSAPLRLFGTGGTLGIGAGSGSDVISVDNPVLDLRRNLVALPDVELLRVRTDDPDPAYLRTTVLDEFTDERWQPSSRDEDESVDADADVLPPPPGLGSGVALRDVRYDVTLTSSFTSSWLPVVYAPTSIEVDGDWRVDRNTLDVVVADEEEAATSMSYEFAARLPEPTEDQLRAAPAPPEEVEALTDLPTGLPEEIAQQARAVTTDADTAYDAALALEQWFRSDGGFVYTTESRAGTGEATIAAFLTDDRRGYCEQFASAMALMARTLDIPARVSVGFLRPEQVGPDTWSFRGADLHAWPELYFAGAGWVRFEPTPAGQAGGGTAGVERPVERLNPTERDATQRGGSTSPSAPTSIRRTDAGPVAASTTLDSRAPAAALVLAVLALVPAAWRDVRRRRRWSRAAVDADQAPEAAWEELGDGVVDLGRPWDRSTTPRCAGRALRPLVDRDQAAVEALNRLVRLVERARFAAASATASPDLVACARDDVERVLAAVAHEGNRNQRRLARWLPRSVFTTQGRSTSSWRRLRLRSA